MSSPPADRTPRNRRAPQVRRASPAPDDEILAIVAVALTGARVVMSYFRRGVPVELKGPDDPVTRADREANDAICEQLARRFPGAGIVAEESAPATSAALRAATSARRVFFVDPLDGTREFVQGIGEFAVMIGLVDDGEPVAGVVALPTEGTVLAGRVGVGAWQLDHALRARAVRLAAPRGRAPRSVVVSRSHTPIFDPAVDRALGPHQLIACGSVGVKAARLALGHASLYLHQGRGLKLWDVCGPEALVRSAGGRVTDWRGAAIAYRATALEVEQGLVAAHPAIHRQILPVLAKGTIRT